MTVTELLALSGELISTHTSLAGRDLKASDVIFYYTISTHTSLAGRDLLRRNRQEPQREFLLTRPSRDVTPLKQRQKEILKISTHTSLAGRDQRLEQSHDVAFISTHTSLAGRDQIAHRTMLTPPRFLLTRPSRDVTAIFSVL